MKLPFFFHKKNTNSNIELKTGSDQLNELELKNLVVDEKEELLKNLNQEDWRYFSLLYNLDKESMSLEFLNKLNNNPTLLKDLKNNFIEADIIQKLNHNNLKIEDIKIYNKNLFQYDIFVDEDKDLLNILRHKVTLTDKIYTNFEFEDYEKKVNSDEFIDINVSSFFDEDLLLDKKKATHLPSDINSVFEDDKIVVMAGLDEEKIFSHQIFDNYYLGDLTFDDVILFIPYDKFLEWSKDDEKRNILKQVQVVIKDNFEEVFDLNMHSQQIYSSYNNGFDVNYVDKLVAKVNHLLYLINNSELEDEEKEMFKYKITQKFHNGNSSWDLYMIEKRIKDMALELQDKLEKEKISTLTSQFNQLDKDSKLKEVEKPKFSVDFFLKQFDNLDEISSFEFLDYIYKLKKEEKKEVLSSEFVIKKLQGLLKESARDEYKYYKDFMAVLEIDDVFKIFDSDFIKHYYNNNRDQNEYRFFFTMVEKNTDETVKYLLTNDEYFKEFSKHFYYYSFKKLDYSLLVNMLKKIEQNDLNVDFSFIATTDESKQFKLLKENFSDDFLVKLIEKSNKKVQQFFYLEDKRFNYLYNKFNILNLATIGYKFSDDVVNKKDFLDKFKSTSLVQFRINVNQFSIHQPNIFFEERVLEYEKELISSYDETSGLFNQYKYLLNNINVLYDKRFINNGIDFLYDANTNYEIKKYIGYDDNDKMFIKDELGIKNYLQELSKLKLNEVIVDILFKDNIYNVFLNIKEMLRFNKGLSEDEKVLDQGQIDFYETILNLDRLNKETIMEVYNKFKDKNVALMFYEDLQKVKNKAYDNIKRDLFQPEKMIGKEDKEKSLKYGVPIFDLRDKEYVIFARCLNREHREETHNKRDCYTLLSNKNSDVMYHDSFVYGYSGFDNDCVLHMFEGDSYSGDVKRSELNAGSDRVNRIMTSHEIATNSHMYSEVQIVNKKNNEKNNIFESLKPSFLIVYDDIDEKILDEAKRKNIPICIINYAKDLSLEENIPFDDELDKYIHENWVDNEFERRKHR